MAIATINPTTGDLVQDFSPHTEAEVDERISEAHAAYLALKATDFAIRAAWMHQAASLLEAEVESTAAMLVLEIGKPIVQARAEVLKCARSMRFYADNAEAFLAETELADPDSVGAKRAGTRYQPLGVVLAVMPWNFPLWQVVRFAAPALMAGNAGLLKHASNVPQTALYLDALFERAGFTPGSFRTLLIPSSGVERVLRDSRVVAATLTGSEPAGRSVATIAGSEVKHVVLELGGSDPFIVMPSADLDAAVGKAVESRTINNGQSCINAKRVIVHAGIYDEFLEKFTAAMKALVMGDPMNESTQLGPLATEAGRRDLHALVSDACENGAVIAAGGEPLDGPGWFYPATVIAGVTPAMRLYSEEAFGPSASVFRVTDREEALRLANDTTFGLSSAVWTRDPDEEEFFIDGLEAGAVVVNGISTSYPQLPFGGVKNSGVGRELAGAGIREFCNLKSVWRA